jgi:hypothetical protein
VTSSPFPQHETLSNGAFRVEELLQGQGNQQLWLARRLMDGQVALVAIDSKMERQSIAEARAALNYPIEGGLHLSHAGHVDRPTQQPENEMYVDNHWLTVELASRGAWLPRLLDERADPSPSTEVALQLGRSAGELLARAAAGGRLLVSIRPEFLWASNAQGRWEVTGVTDRPATLFQLKRYTAFTAPLFDRAYTAPEWYQAPSERSVVYSLALMIHEWASRFPVPLSWHDWALRPVPAEETAMPASLKALLDEALRKDPSERPGLASFLARLDSVA